METRKVLVGAGLTALMIMIGLAAGSMSRSTSNAQTTTAQNTTAQIQSANQQATSAQVSAPDAAQAGAISPDVSLNTSAYSAPAQQSVAQAAQTAVPAPAQKTTITQQQAEQAALAASPGNTVDHSRLGDNNGTAFWDVDFTNGGGATVDAQTGKIIATEAAGTDKGGQGHMGGGADQAALAAQAKITQQQAEQTALAASPGNTVDHSRLGDNNGTIFWDVDFTNGGGATVDAQTGKIIAAEAAGADHGGRPGAPPTNRP